MPSLNTPTHPSRPTVFRGGLDGLRCLAVGLALGLGLAGCGYQSTLAGARHSSPERSEDTQEPATRLAVLALRNDAPEPWLDRIVNDAMRREMGRRGGIDLVDDLNDASLVLRGRIRPLDIRSQSFSTFVAALEYAVTIQLDLEIVRPGGSVVRLDSVMLTETDTYLASADIEVTRTNRLEALRRLSDVLASRVADSVELIERPIDESPDSEAAVEDENPGEVQPGPPSGSVEGEVSS